MHMLQHHKTDHHQFDMYQCPIALLAVDFVILFLN